MITARATRYFSIAVCVFLGALSSPAAAGRKPGTQLDSAYGQHDRTADWQLRYDSAIISNLGIRRQTVCPGNIDPNDPTQCSGDYVFVYQIFQADNAHPNAVLTFSGLSGFAFDTSGFGVLLCDENGPRDDATGTGMLCTQNLTPSDVDNLNMDFNASAGRLAIFIPAIPSTNTLTFYIHETHPNPPGKLTRPDLSITRTLLTPSALFFGSHAEDTISAPQTVVVTNWPAPSPSVNLASVTIDMSFGLTGTCGTLDPGASCVLLARFAPTSFSPNEKFGSLSVFDGTIGGAVIPVDGLATTSGVTVSPTVLTFGSQATGAQSATQTVTISRLASVGPLTISKIAAAPNPLSGAADFAVVDDHCTGQLAAGQSCQFSVAFAPTFPGALSSTLTITDDSLDKQHRVVLSGTANAPGTSTVSTSNLSFGAQPLPVAGQHRSVTFTRSSPSAAVVAVDATPPFQLVRENCTTDSSLASCEAEIAFVPTFPGEFGGALTFASTEVNGTGVVVLSGAGTDFSVAASPASATVARGSTTTYRVTVDSLAGFTGPIEASCSGVPAKADCMPSPASTTLAAAGSQAIDFVVATTAGSATAASTGFDGRLRYASLFVLVACAALVGRRRASGSAAANRRPYGLLLVLAVCLGFSSCASKPAIVEGTPTGTFMLTFQIASGPVVHSQTATLIVQ